MRIDRERRGNDRSCRRWLLVAGMLLVVGWSGPGGPAVPSASAQAQTQAQVQLQGQVPMPTQAPAPARTYPQLGGEYVVISGGPAVRRWEDLRRPSEQHDRWWGNFIRPARMRFEELREQYGPQAPITWLVYREGYVRRAREEGRPLVDFVVSVRDRHQVRLIWFDSGQEVIDYLNRGQNRSSMPIVGLEFFGHSNKHCWMFDYSNDNLGVSRSWLHEDEFSRLRRGAFARNAYVRSWGCHTAESMSAKFRRHTGVTMIGAVGKTDYRALADGILPVISDGGYWVY